MSYLDDNGLLYFWQKIKNTFARATHSHAISDVTDLQTTLNGKAASTHSHAISDVTDLQTTLDGKADDEHTHAIADVSGLQTALDGKAASSHTHAATDITSGVLAPEQGGCGVDLTNATSIADSSFLMQYDGSLKKVRAAQAAMIVAALGTSAVARATADASGNSIADTYAKKTDIAGTYKYKGSVASESALPSSGQSTGDVYNIESASSYGAAGANVAWNGSAWDSLGEIFTITAITNAEIDTIVAS